MAEPGYEQRIVRVNPDGKMDSIVGKSGVSYDIVIESASVLVHVSHFQTGEALADASVELIGRTSETVKTAAGTGLASFDSVIPGTYNLDIALEEIDPEDYQVAEIEPFLVVSGEKKTINVGVKVLSTLEVKVIYADTGDLAEGAKVTARGTQTSTQRIQSKDEPAHFAGINPGQYDLEVILPDETANSYFVPGTWAVLAPVGKKTEVTIEAQKCLRVLFWNIDELGGGFYWPEVRPGQYIDAYATIISRLETDICIVAGLRQLGPPRHQRQEMKDGSVCFLPAPSTKDSGAKEITRIVDALARMDSSIKWKVAYLTAEDDDAIAYQAGTTTCVIYRDHENLELRSVELVVGPGDRKIGLPVELLCVSFGVPGAREGFINEMAIAAPLTVLKDVVRAKIFTGDDAPTRVRPEKDLPVSCLVAITTPEDITETRDQIADRFKAEPLGEPEAFGRMTVPDRSYWEAVANSLEKVLEASVTTTPDPTMQDQMMHWEALDLPGHPAAPEQVTGSLSDLILVRSDASQKTLEMRELRAVDMVRACLEGGKPPSDKSSKDTSKEEDQPLPEDGTLAELCRKHVEGLYGQSSSESQDDAFTAVNKSILFSRSLSDHWPILVSAGVSNLKKLPKE